MDYSVEAWGSAHQAVAVPITFAGILLYVIGIPFGVLLALKVNSKYLYNTKPENREKHVAVVNEFGTLYMREFFLLLHMYL